ncbi:AAA family ATPase [Planctomicrobium sp. SH664]|uniref:AAA family ATPase n=1 Tax=Planctomicrobium sp. SH664 TaxID=3448125 RepID=UPI003F5C9E37
MDTLGTITPAMGPVVETDQRTEALERLQYLAETRSSGVLVGESGLGKSWLLSQLARQLRLNGFACAQIDLTGLEGSELPARICAVLGSGLSPLAPAVEVWAWLQDYAQSAGQVHRRLVFLLDHLDRAAESVVIVLERLMSLFGSSSTWLFGTRPQISLAMQTLLSERTWLRIELAPLKRDEAARVLTQDFVQGRQPVRISPAGIDAAWEECHGRLRRLRQLAELACIAAQVEGAREVSDEMVREAALELR